MRTKTTDALNCDLIDLHEAVDEALQNYEAAFKDAFFPGARIMFSRNRITYPGIVRMIGGTGRDPRLKVTNRHTGKTYWIHYTPHSVELV